MLLLQEYIYIYMKSFFSGTKILFFSACTCHMQQVQSWAAAVASNTAIGLWIFGLAPGWSTLDEELLNFSAGALLATPSRCSARLWSWKLESHWSICGTPTFWTLGKNCDTVDMFESKKKTNVPKIDRRGPFAVRWVWVKVKIIYHFLKMDASIS